MGLFGWGLTPGKTQVFRSDFMSQCFLAIGLYLSEIFAVILNGSNFVPIWPKILGQWAQTTQYYMSRPIKNECLKLVKQPEKP